MPDKSRRFAGVDRLYGAGTLSRLASVHVCVIGLGGVGSWAVEALARTGVGRLTLIDMDHVAQSNINRQIQALESTLGMAKADALAQRIAQINPACELHLIDDFITEDNVATLVPEGAAVLDAIDNVRAKAALLALCRGRRQTVVTTGGAGGRLDPTRIEVVDLSRTVQDVLASKVRARLRKEYGFPRGDKKFGIECVTSPEPSRRPASADLGDAADLCDIDASIDGAAGLACAGYGSSVMVTASVGMAAAAHLLSLILKES
jgi:tRNA threonylcarbamoyladenosine dehydratase